ncbi:TVP38/TMEM64 family protein [Deinococcus malanensis]|uniref:TVP38/TMEM64 family protein n=1 Tax=Deinococcus malanensis TaxID=1706855 RepID=UPI00362F98D3
MALSKGFYRVCRHAAGSRGRLLAGPLGGQFAGTGAAGETTRRKAYEFAERYGVQGVLMVRLMPILSADAMNLVAGAARMPFRPFMLATAAGTVPVTVLVVWLSGSGQRLLWGLGGLSVLVALVAGGRWWLARRAAAPEVLLGAASGKLSLTKAPRLRALLPGGA